MTHSFENQKRRKAVEALAAVVKQAEAAQAAVAQARLISAAEAARRVRAEEALRQIASDIHPPRPDGERPRWMDENSVWWNHLSPQEIARDALRTAEEEK